MNGSTAILLSDALERIASAVVGERPWQVNLGHGTSATFDFGQRLDPLRTGGNSRGSVHLWISGSAWRIERGSVVVVGSDDAGSRMAAGLGQLEGVRVRSVELPTSTRDLVLTFDDSLVYRTYRSSTEEDAWRFFDQSEAIFLDPGGDVRLEMSLDG